MATNAMPAVLPPKTTAATLAAPGAPAPSAPVQVDAIWNCTAKEVMPDGTIGAVIQPPAPAKEGVDDASPGAAAPGSAAQLTVGTKFALLCEGPSLSLKRESLKLTTHAEQKYQLRLLETRSLEEGKGEFIVTSWATGKHKIADAYLSDGTAKLGLSPVEFEVATVVDPQTNPESQPFPPWAPMKLAWPMWVWLAMATVAAMLLLAFGLRLRTSLRRKKLLRLLEKNPIAMTPYHQFNKDLRRLSRQMPLSRSWSMDESHVYFRELDQALRWYLARELVIAAFDRKASEIARDLKKSDSSLHGVLRRDLTVVLDEISQALSAKQAVPLEDAQQLSDLARGLADKVKDAKGLAGKSGSAKDGLSGPRSSRGGA